MSATHQDYLKLPSSISRLGWIDAGAPTDPALLAAATLLEQARVMETLALLDQRLPVRDECGHLLPREVPPVLALPGPGPERVCGGCEASFVLVPDQAGRLVIPKHGHPEHERTCPGSLTPGVEP